MQNTGINFICILYFAFLALSSSVSGDGLYVCNESGEHIRVAYAEFKDNAWTSHGWTSVDDLYCHRLTNEFTNTRYYIYAEGDQGKKWSADHRFCVHTSKDFDIPYADSKHNCTFKDFFSVYVPALVPTYSYPEHYEVIIGRNTIDLNNPRAERN